MTEVAEIAGKLGRTQKAVILSLSEDWGPACNHAAAKRLWRREERLVDHQHMTDNSWCLTKLGVALASHLRAATNPSLESN